MEGVNQEYLDELKQKVHNKIENVDLWNVYHIMMEKNYINLWENMKEL